MLTLIQSVRKGDIIVERVNGKKKMTPVRKVEVNACSKPSVHINTRECYDWGTFVDIAQGDETLGDLQETVDELDHDDVMTDAELDREVGGKELYEAIAGMLVKH